MARGRVVTFRSRRSSGGGGRVALGPRLRWLREAQSQRLQLLDLLLAQFGEPLRHVLDRLSEPLLGVLGSRTDDTATHDVLEELVAGLLEGRRLGGAGVPTGPGISLLFGHVVCEWVEVQQI